MPHRCACVCVFAGVQKFEKLSGKQSLYCASLCAGRQYFEIAGKLILYVQCSLHPKANKHSCSS